MRRTASPTSPRSIPALEAMQRIGMPLLVHGEVTDPEVDVFDREAVFIDRVLAGAGARLPGAEDRVRAYHHRRGGRPSSRRRRRTSPRRSRRSICILNRNALFAGGLRPHAYCLPVAKRERHRLAVRRAATSGSPKFFLGTDSAPHARRGQGSGLRLRRHLQRAVRARKPMRRCSRRRARSTGFEGFASEHGPRFYGLPLNEGRVALERARDRPCPPSLPAAGTLGRAVPGRRDACRWRLAEPVRRAASGCARRSAYSRH